MSGDPLPDIRSLSGTELDFRLSEIGEKSFRYKQVSAWLWKKGCHAFEDMTDLPAELRTKLTKEFSFPVMQEVLRQVSSDGTHKFANILHDGVLIESVLIPSEDRTTACISSQAGCALGCAFCATGSLGFYRNLTAAEIFDQVWDLNEISVKSFGIPLSNIVLMGMGEPLFNYSNVKRAIELLTGNEGPGISPQRLTISTVGVPKMIRQLADDRLKVHLAVSLHAATDEKRNRIIPFNEKFPLRELVSALTYYHRKTRKRFTVEYLLLKDFNDSPDDAAALLVFCRNFPVKINLIEFNPVENTGYQRAAIRRIKEFRDILESHNLVVNIRKSRGKDIDAACGQLAGKKLDVGPGLNFGGRVDKKSHR